MGDTETRLLALESRVNALEAALADIRARLAAIEQQLWQLWGQGGGGFADQAAGLAKITSAVGPGSGAGPGTGFGDTLTTDGSTYTNTGPNVALYNNHTKTIAVNDIVQWVLNNGLRFVVVPGDCGDLS